MLDGKYVANDLLLAHQMAQEHVVRGVSEDVAYSEYGFGSNLDRLLHLQAVVETCCLRGQYQIWKYAITSEICKVRQHGIETYTTQKTAKQNGDATYCEVLVYLVTCFGNGTLTQRLLAHDMKSKRAKCRNHFYMLMVQNAYEDSIDFRRSVQTSCLVVTSLLLVLHEVSPVREVLAGLRAG